MRFELVIEEHYELDIAKSLGHLAFGNGNPTLHESLKHAGDPPIRLDVEPAILLLGQLVHTATTEAGKDVDVTPEMARELLSGMGLVFAPDED